MNVLIDSNVLIRLTQASHPFNVNAMSAMHTLRVRGDVPCIVPQIVYEYWAVCTRPAAQNGLDMQVDQARSRAAELPQLFRLLRDERAVFDHWEDLVGRYDVKGKNTHDARIVAAMLRHRIAHVLTFDVADFKRFDEITVLDASRFD